MRAKRALSPLSDGSKDYGTHNDSLFPWLEFYVFSDEGKYYAFKPWVQKVERIGRIYAYIERTGR